MEGDRQQSGAMTATLPARPASPEWVQSTNWFVPGLAAVGVLAFVLRAGAFTGGWLRLPVDFDEGAYSAAGQLLAAGQIPYRDWVFTHPPGIAYLFAVLAPLGPYRALVLARVLAVGFGVPPTVLIGMVPRRSWGPAAGIVAAAA